MRRRRRRRENNRIEDEEEEKEDEEEEEEEEGNCGGGGGGGGGGGILGKCNLSSSLASTTDTLFLSSFLYRRYFVHVKHFVVVGAFCCQ